MDAFINIYVIIISKYMYFLKTRNVLTVAEYILTNTENCSSIILSKHIELTIGHREHEEMPDKS